MKYSKALYEIMDNIKAGKKYCTWYENMRFPMYSTNLSYGNGLISWTHYGSSANKATLKDLHFVITKLFRMTEEEFVNRFECVSDYEYYHAIHNGICYENVDNGYSGTFENIGAYEV